MNSRSNITERADAFKVFVSYSREDRERAEKLAGKLRQRDFEVFRDLDSILPTEEWKARLEQLITESDAVVFLLSPSSAASEVCTWEVEFASNLGKKIAPIVIEDVIGAEIPQLLSRLNYIFATERDPFDDAVDSLCDAFSVDAEWIREHSRLTTLARRWEAKERPNHLLLSGSELQDAESWLANRPEQAPMPASICLEFIEQGRMLAASIAAFNSVRLEALQDYIRPVLLAELEEAREREIEYVANDVHYWAHTTGMMAAQGGPEQARNPYQSDQDQLIENFLVENARWHPMPAEEYTGDDATALTQKLYAFPCCGLKAVEPVHQFRSDGCQRNPQATVPERGSVAEYAEHAGLTEAEVMTLIEEDKIVAYKRGENLVVEFDATERRNARAAATQQPDD